MAFFVVIEGGNGSGKTTVAHAVADHFTKLPGFDDSKVLLTHEPNEDYAGGKFIRAVLKGEKHVSPRVLELLFAANRRDHIDKELISWHRKHGKALLICARYILSSLVYQGLEGSTSKEIMKLNQGILVPDLTILLDASPLVCAIRVKRRGGSADMFETINMYEDFGKYENPSSFDKYRQKYLVEMDFLQRNGYRFVVVNADQPLTKVISDVIETISAQLL